MSLPDFWEVNSERDEENPKISFEQMKKTITTKRNSYIFIIGYFSQFYQVPS